MVAIPVDHDPTSDAGISPEWREFLYWGKRHHDWERFDEVANDYKRRYIAHAQRGKAALFNGEDDWFSHVRRSLDGGAHPVHWTVADNFKKWRDADPEAVGNALKKLWNESSTVNDRIQQFDDALPTEVVSGLGGRMSLTAYLHMAMDPAAFPPYRVTWVENAYRLTGTEVPHSSNPPRRTLRLLSRLPRSTHRKRKRSRDEGGGQA